jgi:hypothetical protein
MKNMAFCLVLALTLLPLRAQAYDGVVDDVKTFYAEFAEGVTTGRRDDVITLIEKHFSSDFKHIDDGELAYEKDGLLNQMKLVKDQPDLNESFTINIESAAFDETSQEVHVVFVSESVVKEGDQELGRLNQRCSDKLRVLDDQKTFELYECDCVNLPAVENN